MLRSRPRLRPSRAVAALTAAVTASAALTAAIPTSQAHASPRPPGPQQHGIAPQSRESRAMSAASAKAAATDTPVTVDDLTDPTTQTIANPDGSFTLDQAMEPVRVWRDGAWKDLDPTLHFNADGSVSPNMTVTDVKLSGGGLGPFSSLATGGRGFTTGWLPLPKPTLDGATATYNEVITGVDLTLSVEDDGAVNETIVIKNHDGATNPWLQVLKFVLGLSSGTTMVKNTDGTLDVTADTDADPIYSADAPLMWDTAGAPDDVSPPPGDGDTADDPTGTPTPSAAAKPKMKSSIAGPSPTAHVRVMQTRLVNGNTTGQQQVAAPKRTGTRLRAMADTGGGEQTLEITPDSTFLNDPKTVYPVYLRTPPPKPVRPWRGGNADSNGTWAEWTKSGPSAWGYSYRPSKKHSDTGRTEHNLQVGFMGWVPAGTTVPVGRGSAGTYVARSYVQLPIAKELHQNAKIRSSELNVSPWHAPGWSCSAETTRTDLYVAGDFSSKTKPSWSPSGSEIGHDAKPSCDGKALKFNLTSFLGSWLNKNTTAKNINFQLKAHDESDAMAWRQIKPKDIRLATNFNRTPTAPKWPTTAPGGTCQSTPGKVIIGNDDITFSVVHSDPDGGTLQTTFHLIDTATGSDVWHPSIQGASGRAIIPAPLRRDQNILPTDQARTYTWYAQTTDGELTSPKSATCAFTYDPRAPRAPGVKLPPPPAGTPSDGPLAVLGKDKTLPVQVAPCKELLDDTPATACTRSTTEAPIAAYIYQVNSGPPVTVPTAGGDKPQTIQVPVTRYGVNTLSVRGMSAGGNYGEYSADPNRSGPVLTFGIARPETPYRDGDFDGDGNPDLLINKTADASGAWLATADKNSQLNAPVNIGAAGPGVNTYPGPGDWEGTQLLHGDFTGDGVQDMVAYYPQGDPIRPGYATRLTGTGTVGPLLPLNSADDSKDLKSERLRDRKFRGVYPEQLITAGNATGDPTPRLPDLVGVLGDDTKGRELIAYSSKTGFSDYTSATIIAPPGNTSTGTYSGDHTPDNTSDNCSSCSWKNYTITATQKNNVTTLYALNNTDGQLWASTAGTSTDADGTPNLPGAQKTWTKVAGNWTTQSIKSGMQAKANGSLCLEAANGAHANNTKVQAWECNGWAPAQQWTLNSNGNLNLAGDTTLCLDVAGGATANGSKVDLYQCTSGATNQQWETYNGGYRSKGSNRCLSAPGLGVSLEIRDCTGAANQKWTPGAALPKLIGSDVRADGVTELWWRNTSFTTALPVSADGKSATLGAFSILTGPLHNWALNDGAGAPQAADQGDTPGILQNITWNPKETDPVRGPLAHFEGSSWVKLGPDQILQNNPNITISFQFKAAQGSTGILLSAGHDTPDKKNAGATPIAYIGTDGKLYAQFWNNVVRPMTTSTAINDGQWHTVTLEANGSSQSLFVDSHPRIAMAFSPTINNQDPQLYVGAGVFNTNPWVNAPDGNTTVHDNYFIGEMSNVLVYNSWLTPGPQLDPLNTEAPVAGRFTAATGPCMDNSNGGTANGNKVQIYACSTSANPNQTWTYVPSDTTIRLNTTNKCLTASGTAAKSGVVISDCTSGNTKQQWTLASAGQVWNPGTGFCLTNPGNSTTSGTQLQVDTCAITPAQTWRTP